MVTAVSAVSAVPAFSSCTPHRGFFHILYQDFIQICNDDGPNASALRGFEVRCNQRIKEICKRHGIPDGYLPADDDLWLEMPLRDLADLTLNAAGKSTYGLRLYELIDLGWIKRRFIARPGYDHEIPESSGVVLIDEKSAFIVVDDEEGEYTDSKGVKHSAIAEGYTRIIRQYLYCLEKINAATEALYGYGPPESMPRWESQIRRVGQKRVKKNSGEAQKTTTYDASNALGKESIIDQRTQGGYPKTLPNNDSFGIQNNINLSQLTRVYDPNSANFLDFSELPILCNAPWQAETLIGLSSNILEIPSDLDEDAWERDWAEPARWLMNATIGVDPRYAWERIYRHIAGMISGPTWYATKRTEQSPITLRHVVGPADPTKQLTGHNWHVVQAELDKANWYPNELIPYQGPPLETEIDTSGYAAGYSGVAPTVVSEVSEMPEVTEISVDQTPQQEPVTDPVFPAITMPEDSPLTQISPPGVGMDLIDATELMDLIGSQYPTLTIAYKETDVGFVVLVQRAPGSSSKWLPVRSHAEWHTKSPVAQRMIDKAVQATIEMNAQLLDDGGGGEGSQAIAAVQGVTT